MSGTPQDRLGIRAREELRRIFGPPPVPRAADFDPRAATQAELADAGLPLRPDPALTPRLRRFWDALVDRRDEIVVPQPVLKLSALMTMGGDPGASTGAAAGVAGGRWGSSRNWSGAVLAATGGKVFRSVAARWTVPRAEDPGLAVPAGGLPGGRYQCSAWIGLDGFRRASLSLPQVGTVSEFDPALAGQPDPLDPTRPYEGHSYLFVQWWVRGKRFGEVEIGGFPVRHGDAMAVKLDVKAPDDVQFHVRNLTRGLEVTVTWASGAYVVTDHVLGGTTPGVLSNDQGPVELGRLGAPVEGRHAVFCVERPSVMPPASLSDEEALQNIQAFLAPRFGGVAFDVALAELRHPDGDPASAEERDLTAARLLRLVTPAPGREPRTRREAGPLPPPAVGWDAPRPRDMVMVRQG